MSTTPQRQQVKVFDREISEAEAESILFGTDEEILETTAEHPIYYPYQVFSFDLHAEALLNELDDRVHCGIDLCHGKELFINRLPTLHEKTVETDMLIPPSGSIADPETAARNYLLELVRKELRSSRPPDFTTVENQRLHRPFHIVECQTTSGDFLTYIVDGVSGDFHRLYLN
ncbi:hypothetical protein BG842_09975 [Haladaptatus sp. W1]|uniref:hypothetical protein n=1 Tax=Haladaptatus sp. W1 TaxID=1897478 RepID=UPI000849757F|nr:hypothetical protein [Haladaptatus sp. W1]ODR83260.1 hypothetical protein BG842_09975 [Haladaptatus sp. W1]